MPFQIVRNDITRMKVDAIVNTVSPEPGFGRGTDSAVYEKAGVGRLLARKRKIGRIEEGEAAIASAFLLDAKYIIHTAGPCWKGGQQGEEKLLRRCYENSLRLASKRGCESIAFPLISSGAYGFPKARALEIAMSVIQRFLEKEEMMVYLAVFDGESFELSGKLFDGVESYIDEHYVKERPEEEYSEDSERLSGRNMVRMMAPAAYSVENGMPGGQKSEGERTGHEKDMLRPGTAFLKQLEGKNLVHGRQLEEEISESGRQLEQEIPIFRKQLDEIPVTRKKSYEENQAPGKKGKALKRGKAAAFSAVGEKKREAIFQDRVLEQRETRSLEDVVAQLGETFQQRLLRLIDERKMTDVEVYKKANLDRKLFSKIRCNVNYRPKKTTALALALALQLNLDETKDLLARAELALSPSSKFDLIVEYFIDQRVYDIYTINLALFEHEQPLLGDVG